MDELYITSFYAPYAFLTILYRFEHYILLTDKYYQYIES